MEARRLDIGSIISTVDSLEARVSDRFADRGISGLVRELAAAATDGLDPDRAGER